jgi:cell wall assembly regulator SMI1
VRRRGAHKDGLCCNRGSTQDITGSCIRHDGSKDSVALLRRTEELHQKLAQWTRLAQKHCLKVRSTAVAVAPV